MVSLPHIRAACAVIIAVALLVSPVHALVSLNDGTDHIYVTGSGSIAYDSNIFGHAGGDGDYIYSAGFLLEYNRRAGFIGVNATVALDASRFGRNTAENFNDPKFTLEFIKSGGRTTGALNLRAARESEADALANVRTQSWDYEAALNVKYPVIERYSFAGHLAFTDRIYDDTAVLTNLQTYTAGADLLYALTSNRDLLAGYQFRRSETSANSTFNDHSFTMGVSGRIMGKLSGSLRAGYEVRSAGGATTDGDYKGLTASAAVTWTVSKKTNLTASLSRDVSVTAINQSVNTTAAGLTLQHVLNDKASLSGTLGAGQSRFLDAVDNGRHDEYFTWGTALKYKMNDHLDSSLSYVFNQNWSTFSYSDFTRHIVTLTLSSRW